MPFRLKMLKNSDLLETLSRTVLDMKKPKLKLNTLKVKSFTTSPKSTITQKAKGTDGGYTWVG